MKNNLQLKAGAILIIALLSITISFSGYQYLFTPNFLIGDDVQEEYYLYIPREATFRTVTDSLQKNNVLHEILSFSFMAKILKYQDNIKPGRYKIRAKASNLEVIKKLKNGIQDPLNVTFNNIRTKQDLAERLSARLESSAEQILAKLNNQDYAKSIGLDTNTIVSIFIPNTYEFFWTTSTDDLFERMHNEFKKFWNDERKEQARQLNLSLEQVIIIASIVEAETNMNIEKPTIAGVYLNRYYQNWLLQADPTVKFALKDFAIRRVTFEHIKFDSPYNTYKYVGLPPGPINLPSISSIESVLNPEKHKYMFFVADHTKPGYHKFSETFQQHVNSARKYRNDLNKRKIYQ
jgi:UPF0755 protein